MPASTNTKKSAPAKKVTAPKPVKPAEPHRPKVPAKPPLPTEKSELVALAIRHGLPSYEAWALTVDELTTRMEGR